MIMRFAHIDVPSMRKHVFIELSPDSYDWMYGTPWRRMHHCRLMPMAFAEFAADFVRAGGTVEMIDPCPGVDDPQEVIEELGYDRLRPPRSRLP